eukprot:jgi/Mesvir1/18137/Mv09435-RA.1
MHARSSTECATATADTRQTSTAVFASPSQKLCVRMVMSALASLRSWRVGGVAVFDVAATALAAIAYSAYKRKGFSARDAAVKTLLLLCVGELTHLFLEVDTVVTRAIEIRGGAGA